MASLTRVELLDRSRTVHKNLQQQEKPPRRNRKAKYSKQEREVHQNNDIECTADVSKVQYARI